jgi:hypothetical protein
VATSERARIGGPVRPAAATCGGRRWGSR